VVGNPTTAFPILMDYTRLDQLLMSSLDDPTGSKFGDDARASAIALAIREYSRYVPVQRRIGAGILQDSLAPGDTSITVTGGPWSVGDLVKVGLGASQETLTLTAVEPDTSYPVPLGAPTRITFGAATKTNARGAYVTKPTVGLQILAGVDTYELPADFVSPDQESLDIAIGAKALVKKTSSYYDSSYTNAMRLVGPTPNASQNVRGAIPYPGYWRNPNANILPSGVTFRFSLAGQPILQITPVPVADLTLDFYYNAQQTVETIPDADLDAIIDLCAAKALSQRAVTLGRQGSYKEGDESVDLAKAADALQEQAKMRQEKFDRYFRFRPYAVGG